MCGIVWRVPCTQFPVNVVMCCRAQSAPHNREMSAVEMATVYDGGSIFFRGSLSRVLNVKKGMACVRFAVCLVCVLYAAEFIYQPFSFVANIGKRNGGGKLKERPACV